MHARLECWKISQILFAGGPLKIKVILSSFLLSEEYEIAHFSRKERMESTFFYIHVTDINQIPDGLKKWNLFHHFLLAQKKFGISFLAGRNVNDMNK